MKSNAPPGWYPDPSGATQQRFWDGQRWTDALAAPMVTPVTIGVAAPKTWTQRHPVWTALISFWIVCMLWQWPWLPPTLIIGALITYIAIRYRRRHHQLATDADIQNRLFLDGDARGFYGNYPPTKTR